MLNKLSVLLMSSMCVPLAAVAEDTGGTADTPFAQEYRVPYLFGKEPEMNDVRSIAVDPNGQVWAGTKAGVFVLKKGADRWTFLTKKENEGPVFDILVDPSGGVWIGAWDGLYQAGPQGLDKVEGIGEPISALSAADPGIVAIGPDGLWHIRTGETKREPLPCARSVRAATFDPKSGIWIATGMGLYNPTSNGIRLYQREDEILTSELRCVGRAADGTLWAGGLGGVTVYRDGGRVGQFTPKEGLPSPNVQCVACGPDGRMWVGTDKGVARFDGKTWSVRHSQRWLLSDDVRDVAFDAEGTVWIATAAGVSAIQRRTMTLADKAQYFHDACMARHVRKPWLVEKCRLPVPGDTTKWEPEDDDNDGQYTAMYLAMESFRFAVTHDPDAQAKAAQAFEALHFLQTVTETPGFVARTAVPTAWKNIHDPGDTFSPPAWAETRVQDPRFKKVEKRWHPSQDQQWLWKSDTSSDEITGHFFGYAWYYDLAADDPQKQMVREHVRKVMDYIIDGGYVLKDIDGTHTHWGVWAPERLNHDPDWAPERGINSLEILSYLKTTCHITGDDKYQREYLRLLRECGYAENVRQAKTYAPAWRTYIDDELLALAFPALLRYEADPDLRRLYRESLDHWYAGVRGDHSPYFNFTYGGLAGRDAQLDDSIEFLRDTPLDLINWVVDNAKREDLQLVRAPLIEPLQTSRLLPASERGVMRWDKNPWEAVQGDGGHTEWCPTFWLLPYWMGRYHGFIQPPR
jgi:sugar lactone lactonase YvrE